MLCKPIYYKSLQNDLEERIFDDRPEPDSIPPICLLYQGFGRFMDTFNSQKYPGWTVTEQQKLEEAVDSFAVTMTRFYPGRSRKAAGLSTLNNIFSHRSKELMAADVGTARTDGRYNGPGIQLTQQAK